MSSVDAASTSGGVIRGAVLLRAVNVSGRNRVPMAELRALLAERAGFTGVSTYIASGNVIIDVPEDSAAAALAVRTLIAEEFGVDTPAILRSHAQLAAALAANPFPDAAAEKLLHVMFLAAEPREDGIAALVERLVPGERIALRGSDLWIDYAEGGVHTTKLTTAVFDRTLGVPGTARNLRTVRKLVELAA